MSAVGAAWELAVREIIAKYAHALDDRDFDTCVALFADDAVVILNGEEFTGLAAIKGWLYSLGENAAGRHLTTNTLVSDEGGRLRAVSNVAFIRRADAGWTIVAAGRYHDVFTGTEQRIQFACREINISRLIFCSQAMNRWRWISADPTGAMPGRSLVLAQSLAGSGLASFSTREGMPRK